MHEITDMDTYSRTALQIVGRRASMRRPERATPTREIRTHPGPRFQETTARSAGRTRPGGSGVSRCPGSHQQVATRARSTHKKKRPLDWLGRPRAY